MGYLICDKCNEYYELQEGESASDFDSECECGGKVRYVESLDEYTNNRRDITEDPTIEENMQMDVFYEETISLRWLIIPIMLALLFLLFVFLYQILAIPTKVSPTINLILFIVLLLGLFSFNFMILRIKMTQQYLSVSCGIFKRIISWDDIDDCRIDEPPITRFSGYGIRLGRFNGKWVLGYVMGDPKVLLSLNKGRFRDFAFTTKNPHEVVTLIKKQIS